MSAQRPNAALRAISLALLALAALPLAACHVTPYRRTLPEWIQRVYVPMAKNQTAEPGLEELVTKGFQSELIADGRLEVTSKARANAVLQVTLDEYAEITAKFESDNVERNRQMQMMVSLALFDPKDTTNPIGKTDKFLVKLTYKSDSRAYDSELDVNARERFGETAGMRLFSALMSHVKMANP